MAFVVYSVENSKIIKDKPWGKDFWATQAAARAAKTRFCKKLGYDPSELEVADYDLYKTFVEKTVERTNLLTGKTYRESVNTPACCSPSTETYWSM